MNPPRPDLTGVVLAGGLSSRMGRDKALLMVNGTSLWQHQLDVLRTIGASPLFLSRRPGQPDLTRDIPHLHDTHTDVGPLAGLHAALSSSPNSRVAVLAVDMPRINADWFAPLIAALRPGCGAVYQRDDFFEPLAAIYPIAALAEVEAAINNRTFSLQKLLRALQTSGKIAAFPLPKALAHQTDNWNNPEEANA